MVKKKIRCPTSLIIWEMQIIKVRYVTYKIKKFVSLTIPNVSKDIGKWIFSALLVGVEIGITFLKNYFVIGRKVENTHSFNSAIPFLSMLLFSH